MWGTFDGVGVIGDDDDWGCWYYFLIVDTVSIVVAVIGSVS
jgi:hypothetical protein